MPERLKPTDPQPAPAVTETGLVIQDVVADELRLLGPAGELVAADVERRKAQGLAKYGTVLRPHNGRSALVDLYQELLDGAQYARQAIAEGATGPVAGLYGQLLMMCIQVRAALADEEAGDA